VTEQATSHHDLAAYLLGALTPHERARFERHLESCIACRAELLELREPARLLRLAAEPYELPRGLEGRTFAAIEREAAAAARPVPLRPRRRRRSRLLVAAAIVAAGALAFVAGTQLERPEGTVEVETTLSSQAGGAEATVEVRKTDIGRVIRFDSDDLPILPEGEYYELWFVGPGDTRARPNRISAGTFHPDADGRSHVRFAAAVDPAKYPVLSVTAEPGDGNPERTGPEVLRSR
jgi:Anti-sigma-K factor rskA/Putative zinc-finger